MFRGALPDHIHRVLLPCEASIVFALLFSCAAVAGPRDGQWKKVDEAIKKGLPKTAIEQLEPIITGAIKDKAYAEAIKAIGKKIALEGNIQGNKPEEKITRMQAEIAKAPDEMKPVMEAILANWYWHYFQQNRWRFMQRTRPRPKPPGEDFTTWDLPRIFAEIDKQFAKALADEKMLKATPVADYDDLLEKVPISTVVERLVHLFDVELGPGQKVESVLRSQVLAGIVGVCPCSRKARTGPASETWRNLPRRRRPHRSASLRGPGCRCG